MYYSGFSRLTELIKHLSPHREKVDYLEWQAGFSSTNPTMIDCGSSRVKQHLSSQHVSASLPYMLESQNSLYASEGMDLLEKDYSSQRAKAYNFHVLRLPVYSVAQISSGLLGYLLPAQRIWMNQCHPTSNMSVRNGSFYLKVS